MKIKINELCQMAIMLALLIVCSKISVNIGPIPITLQTFAVIMVGYVLKLKKGLIVFLAYILMGLLGIPVFSSGGGFDYIVKPSFGFILGFLLSVFVTGLSLKSKNNILSYILGLIQGLLGLLIIDFVGLIYMYIIMNYYLGMDKNVISILEAGLFPFLLKDTISVVIAVVIYSRVSNLIFLKAEPIY